MTKKTWGGITIGGILVAFLGLVVIHPTQSNEQPGASLGPCSAGSANNVPADQWQGRKPDRMPKSGKQFDTPVRRFMY